jgi:acetyl-CoA carboxylase carboxyltransferase component
MAKIEELVEELEQRRIRLKLGGGLKEIEKQHEKGKLTARERIERLLDKDSFIEQDLWVSPRPTGFDIDEKEMPADGVIIGYGAIDGRGVCIYAQDFTVQGGTLGSVHAKKIIKIQKRALDFKVPLIGLIDSGGVRVQDYVTANVHDSYSSMFYLHTLSSGVIPQISLMMGPCAAGATYSPILKDFLFMVNKTSYMYIASPALVKAVTFEEVTDEELGGAKVHSEVSGCCDLVINSDEEGLSKVRELLGFLPLNNQDNPPIRDSGDNPDRKDKELLQIVPPNPQTPFDMHQVILRVMDLNSFFELKPDFARNMITGFARLNGHSVGVVANNSMFLGGSLDINGADKEARFIRFCDAFNIPIVFFVDTPGYLPGKKQEHGGIIRHGAKVLYAISESTVPKITVYIRKSYGGATPAMCNEPMGSDFLLAWPTAELALMGAEGAVSIIYRKEIAKTKDPEAIRKLKIEEYKRMFDQQPYHAAMMQRVEEIIDPRDTRPLLVKALRTMSAKKVERPWKKHGNIPL